MFNKIFEVIKDNKLKIQLEENKIYISNYQTIIDIEDNKIIIDCNNFILKIYGKELKVKQIIDKEILILGKIEKVEL